MSPLFDVGRICVKIAGRDAGKKCIVVEIIDKNNVLVDGETRRRKVNTNHLEPLNEFAEIESGASHEEVAKVLNGIGITVKTTKAKMKTAKPLRKRNAGAAQKVSTAAPTRKATGKKKDNAEAKSG